MNFDSISSITFDPRTKRYRVKEGAGKGQLISKTAFLSQTEKYLESQQSRLSNLADQFLENAIDVKEFQRQAANTVKEIHVSQTILGANGYENVTAAQWLSVGRELKKQYYDGRDEETGRRYGLRHLIDEYVKGDISEAQFKYRISLYAQSGKRSYWDAYRESQNKSYGKRILGIAEHCPSCVEYANRGIRPIDELPLPTEQCECGTSCKCSLIMLSLEEAVLQGYANIE